MTMSELLLQITTFLPVFLASPTMYAGMLLFLTAPYHQRARAFAAWAGSVITVVIIGAFALSAGTAASGTPKEPSELSGIIDIALGAALIFLAIHRLIKKLRPPADGSKKKAKPKKEESQKSTKPQLIKYAGIGITLTVVNPTSLASYFASAKLVIDSGLSSTDQIIAMAVAGLYYTLPLFIPLILMLISPSLSARFLAAAGRFFNKYGTYIIAVILVLIGVYLLDKGWNILS